MTYWCLEKFITERWIDIGGGASYRSRDNWKRGKRRFYTLKDAEWMQTHKRLTRARESRIVKVVEET